jgi:hypothetical protein
VLALQQLGVPDVAVWRTLHDHPQLGLASCRPANSRAGSRRVRKIDFGQLDGLRTSADQVLREAEDALAAFMEQQAKRDALYVESREELKQKYEFGRMDGVA